MGPFALALFAGALLMAAGAPGPSIAARVSRVIAAGGRDVLPFLAAMWIGEVIWLSAAMAGLGALAQTFQAGFHILKWLGVLYLSWLAWRMWHRQTGPAEGALPRRANPVSMFGAGLAVTLGNPKIMVFYLALLPTVIDLRAAGLRDWAVLSLVTLVTLAAVDLTWVALARKARRLLRTPRATRLANHAGAVALGGAAAAIARS